MPYIYDVRVVGDYLAPGKQTRGALDIVSIADTQNRATICSTDLYCEPSRKWFTKCALGEKAQRLCVSDAWLRIYGDLFQTGEKAVNDTITTPQRGSVALLDRIRRLRGDERAIVEAIVERIDRGRKEYGTWNLCKIHDYPREALEEIFDALNYCAAALLVQAKTAPPIPPNGDKKVPWAPASTMASGGGIQEYDRAWRVKVRQQ